MSVDNDINDAHSLISDYENLGAALSVIAWYYCGESYGAEEREARRHRDALIGISDAFERLKERGPFVTPSVTPDAPRTEAEIVKTA
ncbi:MAG: hypothetical protein ACU0GG_08215 [Paracoccaceae bacterium]